MHAEEALTSADIYPKSNELYGSVMAKARGGASGSDYLNPTPWNISNALRAGRAEEALAVPACILSPRIKVIFHGQGARRKRWQRTAPASSHGRAQRMRARLQHCVRLLLRSALSISLRCV